MHIGGMRDKPSCARLCSCESLAHLLAARVHSADVCRERVDPLTVVHARVERV
jgi:hypothetical protein